MGPINFSLPGGIQPSQGLVKWLHQVKSLFTMLENLSLILWSHTVEGEKQLL